MRPVGAPAGTTVTIWVAVSETMVAGANASAGALGEHKFGTGFGLASGTRRPSRPAWTSRTPLSSAGLWSWWSRRRDERGLLPRAPRHYHRKRSLRPLAIIEPTSSPAAAA